MSITGKIEDDVIDLADLDDADNDNEVEEARPNGKARQQIKRKAQYMAATKGGEVERWIDELTPAGKPFGDDFLVKAGYECTDVYDYTSPKGHVLYQSLCYRHRLVEIEKRFLIRRPATLHDQRQTDWRLVDGWVFGQTVRVIYRWHEVVRRPGETVYVCEGEKNADRVRGLGLLATTVASQKWSENAAEALSGRDVFVLEDNDEAGRKNAANAVAVLRSVARSVRVVRLPGLGRLDAGHTREEFLAVCDAAEAEGVLLVNIGVLDGEEVPLQQWVVENRIPRRCVTLFSGAGGAGKSHIGLQLCTSAVLTRPWMGIVPISGPALFIDAEDEWGVIHRRLDNIRRHHVSSFAELSRSGLHVSSMAGRDSVLGAATRAGRIEPTALYQQVLQMAGDIKPVITVIASSANVFAGSEIDRSQVEHFIALLTRLAMVADGTVVLVSHPSLTGMTTRSGISGSTQRHNAVRARFYLEGIDQSDGTEPRGKLRQMVFLKNNYGPDAESILVEYDAAANLFVPRIGESVDAAVKTERAKEVFLTLVKRYESQNLNASANPGPSYAPKLLADEPEVRQASLTKQDLTNAMKLLLNSGVIENRNFRTERVPRFRLVILDPDRSLGT
jgi:RecA-family ATPase